MSAAIAVTPASGSITAKKTVCRVNVTGASANTVTGYDAAKYPASPAVKYYLYFDAPAGTDAKKSYVFTTGSDGKHEFNNFIFDKDGSWTIRLRNAANDSDVATLAVTVS